MGETFKERLKKTFSFKPGGLLRSILITVVLFGVSIPACTWFLNGGSQSGMSTEQISDSLFIEILGALLALAFFWFLTSALDDLEHGARRERHEQEWQAMRDDIADLKAQVERLTGELVRANGQANPDAESEEEEQIPIPEPAIEDNGEVEQVDPPTG